MDGRAASKRAMSISTGATDGGPVRPRKAQSRDQAGPGPIRTREAAPADWPKPLIAVTHLDIIRLPVSWYRRDMEEQLVVLALSGLAHPLRLKVFRALVVSGPRGLTPGVMQEGLGVPGTTLSFHLKEMANAGLVTVERSSRHIIYRAAFEHFDGVLKYLTENCCEGSACAIQPSSSNCGC